MLFNSLSFAIFFPVVTLVYFLIPYGLRWLWLLAASCAFYMAFVPAYILILFFTIVVDYIAGIVIEGSQGGRRKIALVASIVANVGVLAVFKYYGFVGENLALFAGHAVLPALRILLPIGLSFHTFQAMSYTIEVYWGRQRAERHFGIYALYVMFYPQLVAGPIERPQQMLWQFRERYDFDYDRVTAGLKQMAWGLFKKMVIADRLAAAVDSVYADPTRFHGSALIVATVFFSFQIYYDFSGYSDVALGSARVMGFTLMKNFETPYFASSIAEFWRRWHISLSTWFRDYVYVPLGGNKRGEARQAVNVMIVFLLSGLWHGAAWTFVVWGAIHGVMLIIGGRLRKPLEALRLPTLVWQIQTFVLVTFAWIFFRAHTLSSALYVVTHSFTGLGADLRSLVYLKAPAGMPARSLELGLLVASMLVLESVDRRVGLFDWLSRRVLPLRFAVYLGLVYGCLLLGGDEQQFIYFQF